ncbi:secondary thiamine-phosphate synthase enzyme YjbQ [Leptothoe spongobia]|uniref:YjbQ family protein n=1 Tax=Leptothoe spongobia TAU-MAC 1115 TaxID=1967444 RepID=A0A947GK56_9CYAN|nr:secondary thiamine-phosphate synthase enzyme YjbQ [Leptothoe spongobia]MBT9317049.1 YjbQ family protein [Leptothoe spongobia TAU-MAC 1115]
MPSTSSLSVHYQTVLTLQTRAKSLQRFTMEVQDAVRESRVSTGLCCLFLRHTSASLVIQENADPDVLLDMETFLAKLVPEGNYYRHSAEGPDDMPAHIRTALTHTSEQIPIMNGWLALGTWQGIYIWEHRSRGYRRDVVVHITGV